MQYSVEGYKISPLDNEGSSLLDSYGCLEHINVTLFMPIHYIEYIDNLDVQFKKFIDSPCISTYYYIQSSRKLAK